MGIRKSVGKNKKSDRPAAAVAAKRAETVRRGANATRKAASVRREARYKRPSP